MPAVLTAGSTVVCAHQGTVTLVAGQNKLTIGGQAALVDGDLAGKVIAGCVTVTDPTTSTLLCSTTASALGASRFACGAPGLSVTGGKVLAWAVSERDGSHVPAHGNEARLDLGEVSGGERLSVRLIVRAAAGATVELRATSPRAGTDSAQLTLE